MSWQPHLRTSSWQDVIKLLSFGRRLTVNTPCLSKHSSCTVYNTWPFLYWLTGRKTPTRDLFPMYTRRAGSVYTLRSGGTQENLRWYRQHIYIYGINVSFTYIKEVLPRLYFDSDVQNAGEIKNTFRNSLGHVKCGTFFFFFFFKPD